MLKKKITVESFELDHTIVKAPHVHPTSEEVEPLGDVISNLNTRLVQPNENATPAAGSHTVEHLLAKLIRERVDGMIDYSPFSCHTDFHLIMWGKHSTTEVTEVIKSSPEEIANVISWEDVLGTTIESYGSYKDHSLLTAKEWAKLILKDDISDDPLERYVVQY